MQIAKLLLVFLLVSGGQVIAAEQAATDAAAKAAPAAKKKAHRHKKDCVEKDGKPCHLHKQDAAGTKPGAQAGAPLEAVSPAVPSAVAQQPEVKSEVKQAVAVKAKAVLSDAEGRKLAQQSGCFMCHAIDKKLVSPAWKDVAAKYRGDASIEAKLVSKVAKGGSGVWGSTPMPANAPRVSDANIKALVGFVLSLP